MVKHCSYLLDDVASIHCPTKSHPWLSFVESKLRTNSFCLLCNYQWQCLQRIAIPDIINLVVLGIVIHFLPPNHSCPSYILSFLNNMFQFFVYKLLILVSLCTSCYINFTHYHDIFHSFISFIFWMYFIAFWPLFFSFSLLLIFHFQILTS